MKPIIKRHQNVRLLDGDVLVFGSDRLARNITLTPQIRAMFELIDGTREVGSLFVELAARFPELTLGDVTEALTQLQEANLIEDAGRQPPDDFPSEELERYDRQLLFFSLFNAAPDACYEAQRRLRDARVTLIGCGGVGSHTLLQLACMGVGHIRVIDGDCVELSNLNRSYLFTGNDVGQEKVDVAKQWLESAYSHIEFDFRSQRVSDAQQLLDLLDGSSFAVLSADTPYLDINRWFNDACLDLDIPYSLAGSSEVHGTIGPITIPGETSCFECHGFDRTSLFSGPDFLVRANRRRQAPSFAPIVSSLAALNALEVVKHLTGFAQPQLLNRQLGLDFETLSFEWIDRPRRDDCPACGTRSNRHFPFAETRKYPLAASPTERAHPRSAAAAGS